MALGVVLAVFACDDPDATLDSSSAIWCDALCSRVRSCGYIVPGCSSDCVRERTALAKLTRAGAEAMAPCLERLSCGAIRGDEGRWEEETNACWDQAQENLAPSESVRAFCAPYAAAWFSCGYVFPLDECESIYGMWSDSVLEQLSACAAGRCSELETCAEAVFTGL